MTRNFPLPSAVKAPLKMIEEALRGLLLVSPFACPTRGTAPSLFTAKDPLALALLSFCQDLRPRPS